ncbi:MAG TPA: hypothetical protein VML75_10925 [Kofleriaceae bacterium]|nr:hypothetical protein [Kofleriaceae bacterium]
MRTAVLAAAIAALALAALAAHAAAYLPYLSDDALISLRYADRLLQGDGLTWTAGERVEGYSNLLWVLACAGLGWLGMDLIDAARLLGFLGMGVAICALVWRFRPARPVDAAAPLAGALALAASGCIAVWTVGGLEQPLVAALLAVAIAVLLPAARRGPRAMLGAGTALGLLCLTRPDAVVLVAAMCAGVWLLGRLRLRALGAALALAAIPLACVIGQIAFRRAYYGEWVPNTAHAKLALTGPRLHEGLEYVARGSAPLAPLLVLLLVVMLWSARERALRPAAALLGLPAIAWLLYVVLIGGDHFPGWRHLVEPVVLAAFGAAALWQHVAARFRRGPTLAWSGALLSIALLGWLQIYVDAGHRRARSEQFVWDGADVAETLRVGLGVRDPLLAVTAAGTLPYFSRLPALDMLGLNDRYLATHPPADFGYGKLGHELGDGAYVFGRRPDLIIMCAVHGGETGCYRGTRELVSQPGFPGEYRLLALRGARRGFETRVWARLESPRIGVVRGRGRIELPGYLAASRFGAVAELAHDGALVTHLRAGETAIIERLTVPAGRWRVTVDTEGEVALAWRFAGERFVSGEVVAVAGEGDAAMDLAITAAADSAITIRRVVLERVGGGG